MKQLTAEQVEKIPREEDVMKSGQYVGRFVGDMVEVVKWLNPPEFAEGFYHIAFNKKGKPLGARGPYSIRDVARKSDWPSIF